MCNYRLSQKLGCVARYVVNMSLFVCEIIQYICIYNLRKKIAQIHFIRWNRGSCYSYFVTEQPLWPCCCLVPVSSFALVAALLSAIVHLHHNAVCIKTSPE